jgi:ubiquinone/menaquinone biosynthesis C-methylase UbiE
VVQAPAEALPFADDSFDTAVCTLVLCTVDDPGRALEEIDRVLRPGGALLFMEHVRSDDPRLARWQDRLEGVWLRIGHGCHCNRRTGRLIEDSRLALDRIEHDAIPKAMPLVRPLVIGRANAG